MKKNQSAVILLGLAALIVHPIAGFGSGLIGKLEEKHAESANRPIDVNNLGIPVAGVCNAKTVNQDYYTCTVHVTGSVSGVSTDGRNFTATVAGDVPVEGSDLGGMSLYTVGSNGETSVSIKGTVTYFDSNGNETGISDLVGDVEVRGPASYDDPAQIPAVCRRQEGMCMDGGANMHPAN